MPELAASKQLMTFLSAPWEDEELEEFGEGPWNYETGLTADQQIFGK